MWVSMFNIGHKVIHVPGKLNELADLFSRWFIANNNFQKLQQLVNLVMWFSLPNALLSTDKTISRVSRAVHIIDHCCLLLSEARPLQFAWRPTSRLSQQGLCYFVQNVCGLCGPHALGPSPGNCVKPFVFVECLN